MIIKGRNFKQIDISALPFREDFIKLCIDGTNRDKTLTIICIDTTCNKMPGGILCNGNKELIDEMDITYQKIMSDIYNTTNEKDYKESSWMVPTSEPFLSCEKTAIMFYRGEAYSEI